MGNMAKWGSKVFKVSPSKVLPIEGLTTTVSVKSENQNDTSGADQSNSKGLELQPVEFSATYLRSLGVDPLAELDSWNSLVGKTNPLYIGGKKFGPAKLTLKKVAASDILLSNSGDMLKVTLKFTFEQYSKQTGTTGGTTAKKTSTQKNSSSGKKSTTSASQKAASTYNDFVERQTALKASASKEDKAARKPAGNANITTGMVMLN